MNNSSESKSSGVLKIYILVACIVVVVVLGHQFQAQARLQDLLAWIQEKGAWGPAIFVTAYILSCVLSIPGSILSLGAGAIFGVVLGSIYVSIGSTLGATAAFLIGRYFARDAVARKIQGNENFARIDEAVAEEGWKIVGLIRLSPMFPFNLLNYAFGLTRVSLRDYFFASWIAMMPGTVMYVYIGSTISNLAALGQDGRTRSAAEWVLYSVGLVATIGVSVYVTRIAKRALSNKIQ